MDSIDVEMTQGSMRRRDALACLGLAVTAGCLQLEEADGNTANESGATGTSTVQSGTGNGTDGSESDDEYTPEPPEEPVTAGEVRWEFQARAPIHTGVSVQNDLVIATSDDETMYALRRESGDVAWTFSAEDWHHTVPFVTDEESVFLLTSSETIALETATGDERWRTGEVGAVQHSPPYLDGEQLYVHGGLSGAAMNGLAALDRANGIRNWRFETDGISSTAPAVIDGTVLIGVKPHGDGAEGRLFGVDARTGDERWQIDRDVAIGAIHQLDSVAYVSGENGPLLAVEPRDGTVLWESDDGEVMDNNLSGGSVITTRPVDFDDRLFFGGERLLEYDTNTGELVAEVDSVIQCGPLFGTADQFYAVSAVPRKSALFEVDTEAMTAERLFTLSSVTSHRELKQRAFAAGRYAIYVANDSHLRSVWYTGE